MLLLRKAWSLCTRLPTETKQPGTKRPSSQYADTDACSTSPPGRKQHPGSRRQKCRQRSNPATTCQRLADERGRRTRRCKRHRHARIVGERGFSKRLNPTAWVRALRCNTVYITHYCSMRVPVSICTSYFMADRKALVDSGATDNFMHPAFAKRMGLGLQELLTPKKIFNIDNTSNKSGMITHFLDLNVRTNGINKEM
jgi:hypothetical protein